MLRCSTGDSGGLPISSNETKPTDEGVPTTNARSGTQAWESDPVVKVEGLWKRYPRYTARSRTLKRWAMDLAHRRGAPHDELIALNDVYLEVHRGECVGLIGPNGSGKSTLLSILAGVVVPSRGSVHVLGRVTPLLQLGAGFSPELTGRKNVFIYGALIGLTRKEIGERLEAIVAFSEIEEFLDTPVKFYSSGMYVRLAFAVAAHVDPDVLLIDEILAVGDSAYQAKCMARLQEFRASGKTILLATHNLQAVMEQCTRAILLEHGAMIADGEPKLVVRTYQERTG